MKRYAVRFAPEAEAQILGLQRHIAQASSPAIALRFTGSIVDHCEKLGAFPQRGTPRGDITPGLRTIAFRRRVVIAYLIEGSEVIVLGIFYGGQDFETLIGEAS
jgi:toxin ParE1/3/4